MESEKRQISYIFVLILSILSIFSSLTLLYYGELGPMNMAKIIYSTEIKGGTRLILNIPENNLVNAINRNTEPEIKKFLQEKQILATISQDNETLYIEPFIKSDLENINLQLTNFIDWNISLNETNVSMAPKKSLLNKEKAQALKRTKAILQTRLDPRGTANASVMLVGEKIFVETPAQNSTEVKELLLELGSISFKIEDLILENVRIKNNYIMPDGQKTNITIEIQDLEEFNDFIAPHKGKSMSIILNKSHNKSKTLCTAILMTEYFSGPISITGIKIDEAIYINKLLQSGALPIALEIIEEGNVGTSLGQDILTSGIKKALLALLAIFGTIFILYGILYGAIINLTLIVNLALLILFFGVFKIPVTLSAIAGAITTAAMAVNANILIMEKLLELQKTDISFADAIEQSYNGALTAIIDGGITTLLAGIIMYIFGMNFIKGYALTLIAGLCISFFTSVTCSHALFAKLAEEKE